jgi:hypothetical protein
MITPNYVISPYGTRDDWGYEAVVESNYANPRYTSIVQTNIGDAILKFDAGEQRYVAGSCRK